MRIKKKDSVHIVIAARLGSSRIKLKNLRNLNGIPLIERTIITAKKSKITKNICVNSDSDLFKKIAQKLNVNFYKRQKKLATSKSRLDDYVYDYIINEKPDYILVLNPTSPFFGEKNLRKAWGQFCSSDFDTQLSCERIQTHCFLSGKPLNFSIKSKHPLSQDVKPIRALNFAVTIWDAKKFRKNYKTTGYGVYTGKIGFFETELWENIDLDYEEDFQLAEQISLFLEKGKVIRPSYPKFVKEFLKKNPNPSN